MVALRLDCQEVTLFRGDVLVEQIACIRCEHHQGTVRNVRILTLGAVPLGEGGGAKHSLPGQYMSFVIHDHTTTV